MFAEFWVRLVAGLTFSQPIKKNVAKKWRLYTSGLLVAVFTMLVLHYWAQDAIGPATLIPLGFCLALSFFDPTTRVVATVFYVSLIVLADAIFLVAYLMVVTEGAIRSAGAPFQMLLALNGIDAALAILTAWLTTHVLNEHDRPESAAEALQRVRTYSEHSEISGTDDMQRLYSTMESQPLWRPYEGDAVTIKSSLSPATGLPV